MITFAKTANGWYSVSNDTGLSIEMNAEQAYNLLCTMHGYGDEMCDEMWIQIGIYPVRMEDPLVHTEDSPQCDDLTCPCH